VVKWAKEEETTFGVSPGCWDPNYFLKECTAPGQALVKINSGGKKSIAERYGSKCMRVESCAFVFGPPEKRSKLERGRRDVSIPMTRKRGGRKRGGGL